MCLIDKLLFISPLWIWCAICFGINQTCNFLVMFQMLFNLVVRRLSRGRFYTIINILGFTIALTASLLIYSHIMKEFNMDRFHKNGDNIYRVIGRSENSQFVNAATCSPLAPAVVEELPAVENGVRLKRVKKSVKLGNTGNFSPIEKCIETDRSFFTMFSFPFVKGGRPDESHKDWCVVSEEYARLLFGEKNPVGEILDIKNNWSDSQVKGYQIVGVLKDIPERSSVQAEILLPLDPYMVWDCQESETYLQLTPNADVVSVTSEVSALFKKYRPSNKVNFELQPLQDIYFHSGNLYFQSDWGYIPHGSRQLTLILTIITLVILVLASCNYLLIKIARLNEELPQMALQKCYGSTISALHLQLVLETLIQIGIAFILAGIASKILHPFFVGIMSPRQPYSLHLTGFEIAFFIILLLLLVVFINWGLYLYARKHLNIQTVKNSIGQQQGRYDVKRVLSVVQMCIFCAFLFTSLIILKQMNYLQNKDLGISSEGRLWVGILPGEMNFFKEELLRDPNILAVSSGDYLPKSATLSLFQWTDGDDSEFEAASITGDNDFIDVYQIKLKEGKNISKEYVDRCNNAGGQVRGEKEALVNEAFVRMNHLKNPVGAAFKSRSYPFRIVGVVEDFNYQPLYKSIQPVIISYGSSGSNMSINIRYRKEARNEVLETLEKCNKNQSFYYEKMDYKEYSYSDIYDKDVLFMRMVNIFTCIAFGIGGMGIFAFSVFLAENKKKEIAVRKVNGAASREILALLNYHFVRRTLIACFVGIPVGYYIVQRWLESFAYKISVEWWIFALVCVICVLFVLVIVSWQTWRMSAANPIESLKRE